MVFGGTSVEHFQMDKKEREMCEFEMAVLRNLCCSRLVYSADLSNDDIIS